MIICSPIFKVKVLLFVVSWWELHGVDAKELSTMALNVVEVNLWLTVTDI